MPFIYTLINKRVEVLLLCLVLLGAPATAHATRASSKKTSSGVTANGVYAVDYTNRRVLMDRNARKKYMPASTVKLLTALVVLDESDLTDKVRVSKKATRVEPTRAGLRAGVTYTVADLLEMLVATSANDAGVALAEEVAGSETGFAKLMNRKAEALGAKASHFTNATGLPDKEMKTTPYDFSIITRAAFSHPFVVKAMRKKFVTIQGSDGRKIRRKNHNKLLWRLDYPEVLLKTGYTRKARHCYAGIAYYDDYRVSFVLFKSRKPWDDIAKILGVRLKKSKK